MLAPLPVTVFVPVPRMIASAAVPVLMARPPRPAPPAMDAVPVTVALPPLISVSWTVPRVWLTLIAAPEPRIVPVAAGHADRVGAGARQAVGPFERVAVGAAAANDGGVAGRDDGLVAHVRGDKVVAVADDRVATNFQDNRVRCAGLRSDKIICRIDGDVEAGAAADDVVGATRVGERERAARGGFAGDGLTGEGQQFVFGRYGGGDATGGRGAVRQGDGEAGADLAGCGALHRGRREHEAIERRGDRWGGAADRVNAGSRVEAAAAEVGQCAVRGV